MQVSSRQRGVSLIEVMMAVLVFSVGLIGMAGVLVMATRSNQAAYVRTQVTFLANSMADRMRANTVGVWAGKYDSTNYAGITGITTCNDASPCDPGQVAKRDQQIWVAQLKTFLPTPQATISCDKSKLSFSPAPWAPGVPASGSTAAVAASPGQVGMRPPYGGICTMTISWSERDASNQARNNQTYSGSSTQSFTWEFQP